MEKFFGINTKNYLCGKELLDYIKDLDELVKELKVKVCIQVPYVELKECVKIGKHLVVGAQGFDPIDKGKGTGKVIINSLKYAGAKMVFINHQEKPMNIKEITKAIELCKQNNIICEVAIKNIYEAIAISKLQPEIICIEENGHIESNNTSSDEYFIPIIDAIREIDENILIELGGSIKTKSDVKRMIKLGGDGTGATSSIMKSKNKIQKTEELLSALLSL